MQTGLFAFATACAFCGAALYVNVVEQPARLALDVRTMMQEWKPSNRRGFMLLSSLAVISAVLAFTQYVNSGDVRWIIGGAIVLSSWPYTYFVIVPLNVWLYAIRPESEPSTVRELMRSWGVLETANTAIGLAACYFFAWAIILPP